MKRFIILTCLLLACNLLFAKEKTLFKKQSKYSFIGLYESGNLKDTDGYKYYIVINEDDFEGGRLLYSIVSNNYEKIQNFLTENYKAGNKLKSPLWAFYPDYYTFLHDDLTEVYKDSKIDSKNNLIIERRIWVLE